VKRKEWLLVVSMAFIFFATICGLCMNTTQLGTSWSPTKLPLEITTWIVDKVKTENTMPAGDMLPADIRFSVSTNALQECWSILKQGIEENDSHYTLQVARVLGEYGTPDGRPIGSTDVLIDVIFRNGTKVQINFYNSTLLECETK
jgi:hypothetical protein